MVSSTNNFTIVEANIPFFDKRTSPAIYARWEKLSSYVLKRNNLHVFNARSRLSYLPILKKFFELVNVAYAPLYGTVELSNEQISRYAAKFAPLVNPNLTCFVFDEHENLVALGVAAPSISEALKKSRGRLFPFGWIGLLHAFSKNDTIDLLLIAVRPDLQSKGVNAIVMNKILHGCRKMGIKHAETGPTLELNNKVLAQWKTFEIEQHKRRRCFKKSIR